MNEAIYNTGSVFGGSSNGTTQTTPNQNDNGGLAGGLGSILPISDLLSGLLDGLLGGVLGDISTAGLSCIRSTFTPSKVEDKIKQKLNPWFQSKISAISTTDEIKALQDIEEVLKHAYGGLKGTQALQEETSKWSKCSLTSLDMFSTWYQGLISKLLALREQHLDNMRKNGYTTVATPQTFKSRLWDVGDLPNSYEGDIGLNVYGANYDPPYDKFTLDIYEVEKGAISSTITNIKQTYAGIKTASMGLLLPFVLIGTALYWFFGKKDDKKNKQFKFKKTQKKWWKK